MQCDKYNFLSWKVHANLMFPLITFFQITMLSLCVMVASILDSENELLIYDQNRCLCHRLGKSHKRYKHC